MKEQNDSQIIFNSDLLEFFPAGIIIFDEDGNIQKYNQNLFAFNIIDQSKISIDTIKVFDIPSFKSEGIDEKIDRLKEGEYFELKIKSFKTIAGSEIEIILKAAPVFIENEYKGGILIIEDLQVEAAAERFEQPDFIENILSAQKSFFVVCDYAKKIKIKSKQIEDDSRFLSCDFLTDFLKIIDCDEEKFNNAFQYVVEEKQSLSINSNAKVDGSTGLYRISIVPDINRQSEINSVLILFTDKTEETFEKSNLEKQINELQKFHEFTSKVLDAIINVDLEGNIVYWSENAEVLFGLSRSEIHGKSIGKIIPQFENNFTSWAEEVEQNKLWRGEYSFKQNDENKIILMQASIIHEIIPEQIIILCTNITEKAKFEREIRSSEEKYRNIVINTQEYIFTFEVNGNLTYANPYFLELFGYNEIEIKNLKFFDLLSPDYLELFASVRENSNQWEKNSIELELIKKDGTKVFVFGNITTIKEIDGSIKYCNAVFNDISEKKETEKNLLLIKSVFEASNDGIAIQYKRKYILVNDRFVEMFGYEKSEDVIGKDPLDFVAEEDYVKIANQITESEKVTEQHKKIEFTGLRQNGSKFIVEKTASSYQTGEGIYIVSTLRDVTREREILRNLELSETRYRNILENIDDCLWSSEKVNDQFGEVFYSSAIQKITGYTAEMFKNDSRLWIKIIHPSDSGKVIAELRKFYKSKSSKNFETEYRIINNIGSTVWIRNKIFVLRDRNSVIQKIFGLVSDITLRKRAEDNLLKSTEELKIINNTKDKFISIISHDLRTPFSSILGFTDILLNDEDLTVSKQKQYVTMIQESARNMLSLVNSLLDWTRIQTGRIAFNPKRTNAINIVNKAVSMLSGAALQKNINLSVRIFDDFFIHADENLILQVFTNLISNAIKFTRLGGTISINAKPHEKSRFIQFSVKDNGIGIKSDDMSKLFRIDSKFSTLGTSGERGSGLGLTLVKEIINKHGGEITVESEPGKGSEFIFTLPTSSISVLLIDNLKTDRILYSKIIRNFIPKYSIFESDNSKEAYELVISTYPALVIMENNLPDLDGIDLAKKILFSEEAYKPPIIVLGRKVSDDEIAEYHKLGVEFAFRKPVNLNAFKLAIEKSLKRETAN
jgi:PAS domain S-box-containing protein